MTEFKDDDVIIPPLVGRGIGFGALFALISIKEVDQYAIRDRAKLIFDEVRRVVPMGVGIFNREDFTPKLTFRLSNAVDELQDQFGDKDLVEHVKYLVSRSLGTLGYGDNCILILRSESDTWLMVKADALEVGVVFNAYFQKFRHYSDNLKDSVLKDEKRLQYVQAQEFLKTFATANREKIASLVQKVLREIVGLQEIVWIGLKHSTDGLDALKNCESIITWKDL